MGVTAESLASSRQALSLLHQFNFSVVDDVINHPKVIAAGAKRNLIFTSVWDIILASRAMHLQTCSSCSRSNVVCKRCAWQGHFASLLKSTILQAHPKHAGVVDTCWQEPDHMPTCERDCMIKDCAETRCSTCMFCEKKDHPLPDLPWSEVYVDTLNASSWSDQKRKQKKLYLASGDSVPTDAPEAPTPPPTPLASPSVQKACAKIKTAKLCSGAAGCQWNRAGQLRGKYKTCNADPTA